MQQKRSIANTPRRRRRCGRAHLVVLVQDHLQTAVAGTLAAMVLLLLLAAARTSENAAVKTDSMTICVFFLVYLDFVE